ncbi:hypothetical protein OL229_04295 [Neisseriaceae bacterium JH1-16]|nr:hypothetical protein [Neisseriaceae bacterium JH1-16]
MALFNGLPTVGQVSGLQVVQETNAIDAELLAVLTAAGVTPDVGKLNQLAQAIKLLGWGATDRRLATQAEAEAGTDNVYQVTALRVAQAIAKAAPRGAPGSSFHHAGLMPPPGALIEDGSLVSRTSYANLFNAICPVFNCVITSGSKSVTGVPAAVLTALGSGAGIQVEGAGIPAGSTIASIASGVITLSVNAVGAGTIIRICPWGAGDGVTTFKLPEGQGEFKRGAGLGRNVNAGRALGSAEADDFRNHSHIVPGVTGGTGGVYVIGGGSVGSANVETVATGGIETRPRNVAYLPCIWY